MVCVSRKRYIRHNGHEQKQFFKKKFGASFRLQWRQIIALKNGEKLIKTKDNEIKKWKSTVKRIDKFWLFSFQQKILRNYFFREKTHSQRSSKFCLSSNFHKLIYRYPQVLKWKKVLLKQRKWKWRKTHNWNLRGLSLSKSNESTSRPILLQQKVAQSRNAMK